MHKRTSMPRNGKYHIMTITAVASNVFQLSENATDKQLQVR